MRNIYRAGIAIAIMLLIQTANAQIISRQRPANVVTTAQVQSLSTSEGNRGRFVIVDVRAKAETDVSMIPGAITQAEFENTKQQHLGKAVIVYCTVGHRSGIYANKLRTKGWNAWNYEGSILDWCRHQLPVVTQDGKGTTRVHTYDASYSLAPGYLAVY